MKAFLKIELYGENVRGWCNLYKDITNAIAPGLGDATFGNYPPSGWVAEVTGIDPKYKFVRNFLKGKYDYSRANSKGSRGVFKEYVLESGHIYDVKSPVSWKRTARYYCKVNDSGDIIDLTESEVKKCLKDRLALMCIPQPNKE